MENLFLSAVVLCWPPFGVMIRGHSRRQIEKHAAYFHIAFKIVKGNLFFSAARHPIATTRCEVTAGRQLGWAGNGSFDCFQSLFLEHFGGSKLRYRSQQAFRVWMFGPREQLLDWRFFN